MRNGRLAGWQGGLLLALGATGLSACSTTPPPDAKGTDIPGADASNAIPPGGSAPRWGRLFVGNKKKVSGSLSVSSGLKEQQLTIPNGSDTARQKKKINQLMNLSMQYSPYSYWFANATLRVPISDVSKYSANFRYSFGYDDWHANTFSLVYSNYGDNYLFPSGNKRRTYFEQGGVTLAYKFTLPKAIEPHLLINKGDSIVCQVGYTWVPRYYSLADNDLKSNKNVFLGGCGYTFKQYYFVRATAFWFPDKQQQQPWNGDFSYSFGYAGYKPGTFSLQYANYSGTRFNGNAKFREGTVSLIWYLPF